jgi:hypothetical protein
VLDGRFSPANSEAFDHLVEPLDFVHAEFQ